MKLFKKSEAKSQQPRKVRALSVEEMQIVSGGLNPQPLPPRSEPTTRF